MENYYERRLSENVCVIYALRRPNKTISMLLVSLLDFFRRSLLMPILSCCEATAVAMAAISERVDVETTTAKRGERVHIVYFERISYANNTPFTIRMSASRSG